MGKFLSKFITVTCLLCVVSCGGKLNELQRVSNPKKSVDAIQAFRETHVTVATPTTVYLVGHAQNFTGKESVFDAERVEGMRLTWDSDDQLTIHATSARLWSCSSSAKVDLGYGRSSNIKIRLAVDKYLPLIEEIKQNPSKVLEADFVDWGTNTPDLTRTEVYVTPTDKEFAGEPVLRAEQVEAMHLVWDSDSRLSIHAKKAHVLLSSKSFRVQLSPTDYRDVEIRLVIEELK